MSLVHPKNSIQQEIERSDLEHDKAPEDHRVEKAGVPVAGAVEASCAEDVLGQRHQALDDVVERAEAVLILGAHHHRQANST